MATIRLLPGERTITVAPGTPLQDVLFPHGVEFPCGGRGTCKACRVRVLTAAPDPTATDLQSFTREQIAAGWRLSCRMFATDGMGLELGRWSSPVLADDTPVKVEPREGFGIAIDLGTTTLVAQLVDRRDASICATRTALNPQAQHGADLMTRIDFALHGGSEMLRDKIRNQLGTMINDLAKEASAPIKMVTVVGNTAMHHLFGGVDVRPLSEPPYRPVNDHLLEFTASELGWSLGDCPVHVLPCLGGFVGSDLTAGIIATRLHELPGMNLLIDLGTNGELVCGGKDGLVCASTAAGPAFEGTGISIGMRAATGAIGSVRTENDALVPEVLGGGAARGICGSGLVDAIAGALDLKWIVPSGRLQRGRSDIPVAPGLALQGLDVRQLQLAKGAIATGIHLLCKARGGSVADLRTVYLAGAFGNYIRIAAAVRIGLLPVNPAIVLPAGNTALLGARLALNHDDHRYGEIRNHTHHIELKIDPSFDDTYIDAMGFP
ncbi:MAG: ASKHA domain-containing protein [Planctomycetota bacterium]